MLHLMVTIIYPNVFYGEKKEAFSDGVSNESKSWYEIIQEDIKFDDA